MPNGKSDIINVIIAGNKTIGVRRMDNSKREYIHICGASCVGKNTLRKKIEHNEPGIRERFGIFGSFSFHGPLYQGNSMTLNELAENILNSQEDHVIHQWQCYSHRIIQEIMDARPDSPCRIFLLWRPWKEHLISLRERQKRCRPGAEKDVGTVKTHMKSWKWRVSQQFQHYSYIIVDASTPRYDQIEDPLKGIVPKLYLLNPFIR